MKRKSKVTCYLGGMLLLGGIISAGAISAWTVAPGPNPPGSITINVDSVGSSGGSAASHRRPVDEIPGESKINTVSYAQRVKEFYGEFSLAKTGLDISVFRQALTGFYNLKAMGRVPEGKQVLSIVDFTKPSREKRLWIIDLEEKRLLYHTLVAHGKGSGGAIATRFSNTTSSHQSSLGFYVTGEVYRGKHGRSLRLDGMDPGFNCNARDRAIVLHGASYVSQSFIRRAGRLGRSFGCPAVPEALSDGIIDHIKGKTVLFIHGPGDRYRSAYLDTAAAAGYSRLAGKIAAAFSSSSTSLSRP